MPRLFELPQHVRMPFEEPGQVSEYLDRIGVTHRDGDLRVLAAPT